MSEGFVKRIINNFLSVEDEDAYDENDYEEMEDEIQEEVKLESTPSQVIKNSKVVNLHTNNQMKVVVADPKKYEDATMIADHLRQRRAVIVNLEHVEDDRETKTSIYHFISGVVYVLDGSMQRVSKSIFILAPNNVDIDGTLKKELDSKAFFPWQK